jgi:glutamate-1-semialdehyde aminotransferase
MHPLEFEVACLLRELIPCAEMVRFAKTGAEVTSAAVRLARAFTGREQVLCCGYHGWHDWYIGTTERHRGVPFSTRKLTHTFEYNDLSSVLDAIDDHTACVILEPVVFEPPREDFLKALQRTCQHHGALLIFDEMWTGFRLALGGAQAYFQITPDLATFSKAIANGMPLSVLAGRQDVMRYLTDDVFFFSTFGGEALSLAAAKATIKELQNKNVLPQIAERGRRLREGYNAMAEELGISYTRCIGLNFRTMVTFEPVAEQSPLVLKSYLQQELIRRGVLWSGFHNLSFAHDDQQITSLLGVYREVLPLLDRAVNKGNVAHLLQGEPIQPLFRQTSGFNTKPKVPREVPHV